VTSSSPWRLRAAISLGTGLLSLALTWLFESEGSPLRSYFLWHVDVPNLWGSLNIYPAYLGIVLSGNVHQASLLGYAIGMVLQWGALGLVMGALVIRPRG
jgi:hypothetical protein